MDNKKDFSVEQKFDKSIVDSINRQNVDITTNDTFRNKILSEEIEYIEKDRDALIIYYKKNFMQNKNLIKFMISGKNSKAFIIYQLGWLIEIVLKYILIKNTSLEIKDISNFKHDIFSMMEKIKVSNCGNAICSNINKLRERLRLFRDESGNKLNFSKYTAYRYNHEKDKECLIFFQDIVKEELDNIEEVLNCLTIIMSQ